VVVVVVEWLRVAILVMRTLEPPGDPIPLNLCSPPFHFPPNLGKDFHWLIWIARGWYEFQYPIGDTLYIMYSMSSRYNVKWYLY
jgi:hypothetical protein